jgi:hypothetical protein
LLIGHAEDRMPTRQAESTHDAEQDHPVQDQNATGVESPSADRMQGANGLPRQSEAAAGFPPEGNADDTTSGDQDIDTAGTAHDDLSPTKSM